jgi:hypothetical protein
LHNAHGLLSGWARGGWGRDGHFRECTS